MEDTEYDLMARVEDRLWWYRALHTNVARALARHAPADGRPVLDAGCGTGGTVIRVAPALLGGRAFVGLDYHPLACAHTRARTGIGVVSGTVNALPFADASFAAILSNDVLCHRSVDDRAAAAEAFRCLAPRGVLVINLPAYGWMMSTHDRQVHTARRYTRAGLRALLEGAGFAVAECGYWNTALFPLMALRRKVFTPTGESDVKDMPGPVNGLFAAVAGVEQRAIGLFGPMPFGGSVFAVARRPG
jgi:SAM-dependent methyltransferase